MKLSKFIVKISLSIGLMLGGALTLFADDAEAKEALAEAEAACKDGDTAGAADKYLAAELYADDLTLKIEALQKAVQMHRASGMLYQEFLAIEKLLTQYPAFVDAAPLIKREFELGQLYFEGKREPAFWCLRSWKFLHGLDRTLTIYTKALERSPFAPEAQKAHLQLATTLLGTRKAGLGLEHLRQALKLPPTEPKDEEFTYLLLIEQLYLRSGRGDGDGANAAECVELITVFREKFSNSKFEGKLHLWELGLADLQAQKLLDLAKFYRKKNLASAQRYLRELLTKYPAATCAKLAEKLLVELDPNYLPGSLLRENESRVPKYEVYELPEEGREVIAAPGAGSTNLQPMEQVTPAPEPEGQK